MTDVLSQKLARFHHSLLNAAEKLDPDITSKLPQQITELNLGGKQTEREVTIALRSMTNSKAVGTGGFPAKLLKLGLIQDQSILREFDHLMTIIWREGNVLKRWKDATIMSIHKNNYMTDCESYRGISLVSDTGKVLQSKWSLEDLANSAEAGTSAQRTEQFSLVPIDHGYDVCCSPTAGARVGTQKYRSSTISR